MLIKVWRKGRTILQRSLLAGVSLALVLALMPGASMTVAAAGNTFYVSRLGNNAGGRSWATAWNELNRIDWSVVQPGDTILIDGGATPCVYPTMVTGSSNAPRSATSAAAGMVYETTLTIGKSGTPGNPITIKLAPEPGRNGTVCIFGGRSTPLPYCGQTSYSYDASRYRENGIRIDRQNWIVIDGTKWAGFVVYGHRGSGIELYKAYADNNYPVPQGITIRGVEVYDNGWASRQNGAWSPDGAGVDLAGKDVLLEQLIVHDNGQDAMQSGGGINNITVRRSWLFNQRPHPLRPDEPFNDCQHSDGIQVYGGGNQYGLTVDNSIVGPGFMQGLILGDHAHANAIATVHNVTLRNSLFVGHHGPSSNAGILTKHTTTGKYTNDPPTDYVLDHITVVRDIGSNWWNVQIQGSNHTVRDCVFYGGRSVKVDGRPAASGNIHWQVNDESNIADQANPRFIDNDYAGVGSGFADFDLSVRGLALTQGAGSSITSVAQLLAGASPPPSPPPTSAATATPSPSPSLPATPTPGPLAGLGWQAEAGTIAQPFRVSGGYLVQPVETDNPGEGGGASYPFDIVQAGDYVVHMLIDAADAGRNSLFVSIDQEPEDPTMIWDIPLTTGFEQRTVGWRGDGTPENNEYPVRVFALSAGRHELVVRGREANVRIDRVKIEPYAPPATATPTNTPVPPTPPPTSVPSPTATAIPTSTPEPPTPTPVPEASPSPPVTPETRVGPLTLVLKQGRDGYSGCHDTYIHRSLPDESYRWENLVKVGQKQRSAALLRFSLSGLPKGAVVTRATLRLYAFAWSGSASTVGVYRVIRDTAPNEATWHLARAGQPWGMPGCNDLSTDRVSEAAGTLNVQDIRRWFTLDVTALVQGWLDGAFPNRGVLLRSELPQSTASVSFASAQHATAEWRPELVIEYRLP